MAFTTLQPKNMQAKLNNIDLCPRCKEKLLTIDGNFIKWITCPKCKYKKLIEKERKKVNVFEV